LITELQPPAAAPVNTAPAFEQELARRT